MARPRRARSPAVCGREDDGSRRTGDAGGSLRDALRAGGIIVPYGELAVLPSVVNVSRPALAKGIADGVALAVGRVVYLARWCELTRSNLVRAMLLQTDEPTSPMGVPLRHGPEGWSMRERETWCARRCASLTSD
jgi:hypothetical protein